MALPATGMMAAFLTMKAVALFLIACMVRSSKISTTPALSKVNVIVDTDLGFDVDDAVALCLANSLHQSGDIQLLATLHNTGCHLGVGGISSINNFYGHNDVLLGAYKGSFGSDCDTHFNGAFGQNQYLSKLVNDATVRGPVTSSDQVPSAVSAYRQALAKAQNESVNIASIGITTNIRDLLLSTPDNISSLSGYDLVSQKVAKIVFMDGGYNFGCAAGFIGDAKECYGSAQAALKSMPPNVRMVFSNKGSNPPIYTGANIQSYHPPNSPCRVAMKAWCCNPSGKDGTAGRLSWDPIAVMIASLGVRSVAEKEVNYGTQVSADANGAEHFYGNGTRNAQTDFASTNAPSEIVNAINSRLAILPN